MSIRVRWDISLRSILDHLNIKEKNIGLGFTTFYPQAGLINLITYSKRYQELLSLRLLENKELFEGFYILLWLFKIEAIDKKTYISGVSEISA